MEERRLLFELNKILTLEHGHLGLYKEYRDFKDKEIRRVFRRFMEIEVEHISKLERVIRNLGATPSVLIESGDIVGHLMGVSTQYITKTETLISLYSKIEKKSYEGYNKFVSKIENDAEDRNQFIAEIASANMLEAELMHLWLENKLSKINSG